MPIRRRPGRNTRFQTGVVRHRNTPERLAVVKEQAIEELATPKEQSIGIIRAREIAAESGITANVLNAALANGEIKCAEKQGQVWHISPTHLAEWIREH